jgi:hypothetical protein
MCFKLVVRLLQYSVNDNVGVVYHKSNIDSWLALVSVYIQKNNFLWVYSWLIVCFSNRIGNMVLVDHEERLAHK